MGNCGVLDKNIEDCGIVNPTKAIRDEGTSYHYAEAGDTIEVNKKYKEEFIEVLNEAGYPYVEGTTWTTDACYRETSEKMKRRKKQGAIIVEMECAGNNLDHDIWDPISISGKTRLDDKSKIMFLTFKLGLKMIK